MLQKQEKSVSNMPAKIDIDAPKFYKIKEQMRLNIGKKLKIASLDSRFTSSKKVEECTSTRSLLKNFET